MRRTDCSQMTDGGAGIVLVGDGWLRDHPGARPIGRIDGWGHRTVGLGLQQKLDRSADEPYVLPHVRQAVLDAFGRAACHPRRRRRLRDPRLLHAQRVHGHRPLRAHRARRSWKAIENGDIEIGGRLPINPSGGLIGGGHPVGATGVRMLLDAAKQVTGGAGDYQVEGARTFGTLNIGGSTTTTVSFVVERRSNEHGRRGRRQVPVDAARGRRPPVPHRPVATADHRVRRRRPDAVAGEIPPDLDGVYLRNTENPLHPALKSTTRSTATAWCTSSASGTGRRSTATGSSAPTGSPRRTRRAGRCGPAWPSPCSRQARQRLGRAAG